MVINQKGNFQRILNRLNVQITLSNIRSPSGPPNPATLIDKMEISN